MRPITVPLPSTCVLWDGAPYHRAKIVREAARALNIELMSLPGYSPDLMPVEALWHWLREDVTYHHCHASAEDLTRRAADFEARINQDPCALADRLWGKDCLDPEEEKLRFSNETWLSLTGPARRLLRKGPPSRPACAGSRCL